jgi:hypothetical protein
MSINDDASLNGGGLNNDPNNPIATNSFCDPYSVFGATLETSLVELRQRYFQLSLLCHPDKGGCAEDMIVLKRAYDIVRAGQENRDLSSARMCNQLPTFADILRECCVDTYSHNHQSENCDLQQPKFDNDAFQAAIAANELFVPCSLPNAPILCELEDIEQPDNEELEEELEDELDENVPNTNIENVENVLVEYRPMSVRRNWCMLEEPELAQGEVFDFSIDAPLCMLDLCSAYEANNLKTQQTDPRESRALKQLLVERSELQV